MKDIDHSPYAVAYRLDNVCELSKEIDCTVHNLLTGVEELNAQIELLQSNWVADSQALDSLLKMQQKILDRLEILEKSANTLHLKRAPKNE